MRSQYSAENVCVSGGGRAALTRAAASLGSINLGHFLPDYTAYEELLDIFKAFTAIPILLEGERGYAFSADDLRREVHGRGLAALLLSNPCNPTGKHIRGDELARWVAMARELDCSLLIDEFYSHYLWSDGAGAGSPIAVESAATATPMTSELPSASSISRSRASASYHVVEKPPQTDAYFDALKLKTTSTAIGT